LVLDNSFARLAYHSFVFMYCLLSSFEMITFIDVSRWRNM